MRVRSQANILASKFEHIWNINLNYNSQNMHNQPDYMAEQSVDIADEHRFFLCFLIQRDWKLPVSFSVSPQNEIPLNHILLNSF